MRNGSNDSRRYYDWLSKADEDLSAARLLITRKKTMQQALFHCHQAIEKSLKGYLLFIEGKHYDGHNLMFLCRKAGRHDGRFMSWHDELIPVSTAYIEARYPSDFKDTPDRADIARALSMAGRFYDLILESIQSLD